MDDKVQGPLIDSFGRIVKKIRISVTDKCNFRCVFCMPNNPEWLPNDDILSFDEICRVVSVMVKLGVEKVRITGGEPLIRPKIEDLIRKLSGLKGIKDISMTTNAFFLAEKAKLLKEAGLKGITVSLHSIKPSKFFNITQKDALKHVLEGISAALNAGIKTIKVNAVIIRGYNDDEIEDLAKFAYETGITVRFIEFMPFDGKRFWNFNKVVTGKEIVRRIGKVYDLIEIPREPGSTARLYRFANNGGTVGIITSISEPFCQDCDRVRLTADGKIVPCMFDSSEYDLKPLLRGIASDEEIAEFIKNSVRKKAAGVEALLKEKGYLSHVRPMHTLGG